MLTSTLIHPEITAILARAGHSSQVLIADGNYPAASTLGPRGALVSLNLAPGLVTVRDVFRTLLTAIPLEAVAVMGMPPDDPHCLPHEPPVWADYRQDLSTAGLKLSLDEISRWDFYEAVASPRHVLTIQTGDLALWSNLLLTIGVRETAG